MRRRGLGGFTCGEFKIVLHGEKPRDAACEQHGSMGLGRLERRVIRAWFKERVATIV